MFSALIVSFVLAKISPTPPRPPIACSNPIKCPGVPLGTGFIRYPDRPGVGPHK
jgi:hypothetical protein